jgi:ribonuclease BN (tRNA processing enzyme)
MSTVVVEFLGCGDAFGSGGRFLRCLMLEGGGPPLLVDCGASAVTALQQRRIDPRHIGVIALSHLHGDHFGGLPFLLLDAAYNRPRTASLVIAGPAGTESRLLDALDVLFPGSRGTIAQLPVRFVEWQAHQPVDLGGVEVTPFPVHHSTTMPCFALRIVIGGRIVTYSGDSEWTDALIDASRDADLFVCECVARETPIPSHLSLSTLRANADRLLARRIVLTHLGPELLAGPVVGEWERARDGLVITLPRSG